MKETTKLLDMKLHIEIREVDCVEFDHIVRHKKNRSMNFNTL
jgi:hypothetical protein